MSIRLKFKYAPIVLQFPSSIIQKKKYVFIISHMRSYSTLLSHILGNHKEIDGYSELHYSYFNYFDNIKAKIRVMYTLGNRLEGQYILDKLLHNENQISNIFLQANTVKLIFLLRQPHTTYKSQINRRLQVTKTDEHIIVNNVHYYYTNRLVMLKKLVISLNADKLFIKSEDIINNPDPVLKKIQGFLSLGNPLTKEYEQFRFSGKRGYGDSSENIKSGRITNFSKKYGNIHIPKELLSAANNYYDQCKEELLKHCSS